MSSSKKGVPAGTKRIKGATVPSNSRDLISTGPKDVEPSARRNHDKRDENGNKPTTARALVIRNGKYGAMGTGELAVVTKISGREKLDLLAEDLIDQAKLAVVRPFNIEDSLKIAESQLDSALDEINNLQDPELFHEHMLKEIAARIPPPSRTGKKNAPDLSKDVDFVASVIGSKIHNAYMLSSAWKLVRDSLRELYGDGLRSNIAKTQLKEDDMLRERYMVLYDMVNVLVNTNQKKFAVLATTTEGYAPYFKTGAPSAPDEFLFDWAGVREACKSFIDSIVIELCFPDGRYPKQTLYHLLHDAVDESPRDAKRFNQDLWDAVGDLSVSVDLLDMLERPLAGPEGEAWREEQRQMPDEFEDWVDAQIMSEKASAEVENYKNVVNPLIRTKNRNVLENMWKYININYEITTGHDIDTLWGVKEVLKRKPQWHAHYVPENKRTEGDDEDYDSDSPPGLVPFGKGASSKKKKVLALTDGTVDKSDDSMPDLQSVSNSSEEDDSDDSDDDDEEDDDESDASAYDTDEEDELRAWHREAMETAGLDPDFYNPRKKANEFNAMAEERKGNPFLKLLGSLRGRMFSSKPSLSARDRDQTRKAFKGTKPSKTKTKLSTHYEDDITPKPKSKTTAEDVDEDEDAPKKKKKKPKKKKKKKKAAGTAGAEGDAEDDDEGEEEEDEDVPATPAPAPAPAVVATPASPPSKKKVTSPTPKKAPAKAPSLANQSTTSLLPVEQTVAESTRKYLEKEGLDKPKEKVKSRPDPSMTSLISEKEKNKFLFKNNKKGKSAPELTDAEQKKNKSSYFSKLGKKSAVLMHQLLGTAQDDTKGISSMKWDSFVKVMREMGFKYNPSTAGSSVRFDPPNKCNNPITFHKPHPDTTIHPIMLKVFAKKLKRTYGWNEEDFLKYAR